MGAVTAAVGILRRRDGKIFLQRRPPGTVYAGYWEFPGGKVEAGETPSQAVVRELKEEIGVTATELQPWLVRRHEYEHAVVELHCFRVTQWQGEFVARQGQEFCWRAAAETVEDLLPPNRLLWKWQRLPDTCIVTAAEIIGVERTLTMLPALLARGVRLFQLRDKNLPADVRHTLAKEMAAVIKAGGGLLLINDDERLVHAVGADGVHLSSKKLMVTTARPPFEWVGASCHSEDELKRAAVLEADFAVLSPVKKTLTHVDAAPVGWETFAVWAAYAGLPVYALGGMDEADKAMAFACHGQGIAMMRRGWAAKYRSATYSARLL